jgi:hypothetical protein
LQTNAAPALNRDRVFAQVQSNDGKTGDIGKWGREAFGARMYYRPIEAAIRWAGACSALSSASMLEEQLLNRVARTRSG